MIHPSMRTGSSGRLPVVASCGSAKPSMPRSAAGGELCAGGAVQQYVSGIDLAEGLQFRAFTKKQQLKSVPRGTGHVVAASSSVTPITSVRGRPSIVLVLEHSGTRSRPTTTVGIRRRPTPPGPGQLLAPSQHASRTCPSGPIVLVERSYHVGRLRLRLDL
ncbi:uncharacterized protein EI97DRAFT_31355 [Westerdykella ornata]|uniref:Uncharacterized protein n=1 Tax=Westerdykella ornata TaxID=318751 RepID=A0A6A6JZ67_WESOR|nr:uncharacterized protein EI97DRAFT_31355 [Westerdykella ornata]KAF2281505.1 hypothetical protein EI97DRAFT_31355 [Westerdykella ornata]